MAVYSFDMTNRSYVYALLCQDGDGPGYVKFGRSDRIGQRLSALRTSCPIPARYFAIMDVGCLPVAKRVEKALHIQFKDRRIKGEWFRFDFKNLDDKKEFNYGCGLVFAAHIKPPFEWTKISVKELDEYNKARQAMFLQSKNSNKAIAREKYRAKQRAAHKELAAYGT